MAFSKNRRLAQIISDANGNLSVQGITVPTQSASDNDTSAASTAFVHTHINALLDSAPDTLNTLNEIAAALNDDANFNTTVTNAIAGKVALSGSGQTIADSGNFAIDAAGGITLDADGGQVDFKDAGTLKALIDFTGSNVEIQSRVTDADMLFRGQDDNSFITALTLDMSEAGAATFNNSITAKKGIFTQSGGDFPLVTSTPYDYVAKFESTDAAAALIIEDVNSTDNYNRIGVNTNDMHFTTNNAERMRIDSSGNVGIGTNNPSEKLEVVGSIVCSNFTDEEGIFFRSGFTNSNKYNVSIMAKDHNGNAADGLSINGYDGISFCTGSNSRNEVVRIQGGTSGTGRVGIGTSNPSHGLTVSDALAGTSESRRITIQSTTHGVNAGYRFDTESANGTGRAGGLYYSPSNTAGASYLALSADDANTHLAVTASGNIGIGTSNPEHILHLFGGAGANLVVSTADNYKSEVRMMEDAAGTAHGGYIRYDGNGDYVQIGHYNSGTDTNAISIDDGGNVGLGVTNPAGHFEVHNGRMGIISTSSSWEQLRVCNPNVAEAGIAIFNGATASEFLADNSPSFSNAFTFAINPYGCGTDTLAIGHGNLTDSIWHIDGSGNFGYGPNTENPVSYYEISKNRPNVHAPSDYELKLSLNTYGYVNDNYKLAMLQWLGGDSASAQDNFYAGIGSTALDGSNNSEEGSLDFHVRNGISTTNTLAMQIIGKAGTGIAGGGQHAYGVMFPYQGIAIDRVWGGYPGISVFNSAGGGSGTMQSEFRFHGTNSASTAYPGTSGADFSAAVRADGGFITGSDRRRKKNITTINNALDTVKQLTGKRFQTVNRDGDVQEHVSKNGYQLGFIAQDIEDIIPETIKYHPDEDDGTEGWNTAYSMDYAAVVALLVNAIKEQDTTIQDLKSRIETLEG